MITEHFCASRLINDHAKVSHNALWMSNNSHARIGSTTRFLYSWIRGINDSSYVSDNCSISRYQAADHMDDDCGKAIASLAVLMPSFCKDGFKIAISTFEEFDIDDHRSDIITKRQSLIIDSTAT